MVDVVDGDESPSPEPRTDSRSALLSEIRAWRWLRIVKHNETFSDVFLRETEYMELELRSAELQGAHETGGRPPTLMDRVWAPWSSSFASIFYIFCNLSPRVFMSFRELLFLHIKQHHGSSAENSVSPG